MCLLYAIPTCNPHTFSFSPGFFFYSPQKVDMEYKKSFYAFFHSEDRPLLKMKLWMQQLCSAISYIHSMQLTHRDLKVYFQFIPHFCSQLNFIRKSIPRLSSPYVLSIEFYSQFLKVLISAPKHILRFEWLNENRRSGTGHEKYDCLGPESGF